MIKQENVKTPSLALLLMMSIGTVQDVIQQTGDKMNAFNQRLTAIEIEQERTTTLMESANALGRLRDIELGDTRQDQRLGMLEYKVSELQKNKTEGLN